MNPPPRTLVQRARSVKRAISLWLFPITRTRGSFRVLLHTLWVNCKK